MKCYVSVQVTYLLDSVISTEKPIREIGNPELPQVRPTAAKEMEAEYRETQHIRAKIKQDERNLRRAEYNDNREERDREEAKESNEQKK